MGVYKVKRVTNAVNQDYISLWLDSAVKGNQRLALHIDKNCVSTETFRVASNSVVGDLIDVEKNKQKGFIALHGTNQKYTYGDIITVIDYNSPKFLEDGLVINTFEKTTGDFNYSILFQDRSTGVYDTYQLKLR